MKKMNIKNGKVCAVGLGGQSVFLGVDHFHAPGETLHAGSIYSEPGGKAYNQAVAAARLGAEVIFVGAMGGDENGKICRDFLKAENIEDRIMTVDSAGTAYACILTDASGENRVTVYSGAADMLSAEYVDSQREELKKSAVMLLGLECPLEATEAALRIAEENGIMTILNPAPARKLGMNFLRRFDIITPNAQEAAKLFSLECSSPAEICRALKDNGIETAVVTLGGEGALLYKEERGTVFSALRCIPKDTTGAGDCFNAALAAALINGGSLEDAVIFAINASALSVQREHVMTALPYLAEVKKEYRIPKSIEITI